MSQNTAYITEITREQGIAVKLTDDNGNVYGKSVINPNEWYTELGGEKIFYIDASSEPPKMIFNGEFGTNITEKYSTTEEMNTAILLERGSILLDSEGYALKDSEGNILVSREYATTDETNAVERNVQRWNIRLVQQNRFIRRNHEVVKRSADVDNRQLQCRAEKR
jgi:hypothetical protein